mmetsp:Transcript_16062/g.39988  ORF Transcript_16062/g.39988 Transcript_16062/m.39988 type:complete len:408 (+) Transcript_16062:224-1447(+)
MACLVLGGSLLGLDLLAQHLDNRLEGKPLGDVLAAAQHLAELGAGQVELGQLLLVGNVGGDVALLLGVRDVEGGHGLHAQLSGVLVGHALRVVRAVEILASERGLGARHVAADDEVRAAVVLADDHVLDGLTGARHVHGVGQVRPAQARVVGLRLEHLVRLVAHVAGDVVVLGGAAGGVHQAHAALAHVGRVQRADEQLVVRPVDGVAALEGQHVGVLGQGGTHLGGGGAGEHARGDLQPLHLAAQVVLAALHGNHLHSGVLQGGGAVHRLGLLDLVGEVLGLHVQGADVLALVGDQQLVADLDILAVGVKHDRDAQQQVVLEAHGVHDALVLLLVQEAGQGGEAANGQQLHIASIAIAGLHGLGAALDNGIPLVLGHLQVDQLAAVWGSQAISRKDGLALLSHSSL